MYVAALVAVGCAIMRECLANMVSTNGRRHNVFANTFMKVKAAD